MSEYQYYEFAAIERQLTKAEMAKLRAISTRAVITPTSFSNHYEWGNLKASPAEWMQRYFDAFVYTADAYSRWLSLRVPLNTFARGALKPFALRQSLTYKATMTHWIIDWSLDDSEYHEDFAEDDGRGWMQRLVPLRDELLRGDLRPLYLGWLAGADTLQDEAQEPLPPPGLAQLTPAQQALAEFLEVDVDLLEAAASASAAATMDRDEEQRIGAWLDGWQAQDMKDVLTRIALGQGQDAERRVKSHFAAWLKVQRPSSAALPRRRLAELRALAQSACEIRQAREAKARAKQDAARQRQREAVLRRLMACPDKQWKMAHAQAGRGVATGHDRAVRILCELAEGYALVSSREAFDQELQRFLVPHARSNALLRRLATAGLCKS